MTHLTVSSHLCSISGFLSTRDEAAPAGGTAREQLLRAVPHRSGAEPARYSFFSADQTG